MVVFVPHIVWFIVNLLFSGFDLPQTKASQIEHKVFFFHTQAEPIQKQ